MKSGFNIRKFVLSLVIAGALLVSGACSLSSGHTNTATPAALSEVNTGTADFVDAVARVMPSVTRIEVTFGTKGSPDDPNATGAAGTGWI